MGITLLILEEGPGDASETLRTLEPQLRPCDQCVRLARRPVNAQHGSLRLLGERYYLTDPEGRPLRPDEPRTREAMILLRAGDTLEADGLSCLMGVLAAHPELSYAHGWRWIKDPHGGIRNDFRALEFYLDNILFVAQPPVLRTLIRTPAGMRIDDVFDLPRGATGRDRVPLAVDREVARDHGAQGPDDLRRRV